MGKKLTLTQEQWEWVAMQYWHGYRIKEICDFLEITSETLHRYFIYLGIHASRDNLLPDLENQREEFLRLANSRAKINNGELVPIKIKNSLNANIHGEALRLLHSKEAGTLLELPIPIGSDVWLVDCGGVGRNCKQCELLQNGLRCRWKNQPICPKCYIRPGEFTYSMIPEFGISVFADKHTAQYMLDQVQKQSKKFLDYIHR